MIQSGLCLLYKCVTIVDKVQMSKSYKWDKECNDWLIDCCLMSSGKYFMHIQDRTSFQTINQGMQWKVKSRGFNMDEISLVVKISKSTQIIYKVNLFSMSTYLGVVYVFCGKFTTITCK